MNRIRLLPEQVANQIAAGEVVERPAAVVKELTENALDAEARQITIAIKNGGRSLVRVTDDGWGMSRDDALLALERHATSKITTADDLHAIRSLGFRGEALPSIASVSRFTMVTRERDALGGTRVEIAGGRIVSVTDEGAAPGTSVEVRNLFFNLPARRKFLRSEQTETAHIEHIATLCALANPAVAFRLVIDDRDRLHLAPATALRDRLRELYGSELSGQLLEVGAGEGTPPRPGDVPLRVHGFIGKAGLSRADRSQQHLFVNRRPVESRGLSYALLEGYRTALMKGRYPITFLFIDIDPALVDVNIHPAKREVRFRDEYAVRQAVIDAVRAALEPQGGPPRPIQSTVPESVQVETRPNLVLRGQTVAPVPEQPSLPLPAPSGPATPSAVAVAGPVADGSAAGAVEPARQGPWRILGVIAELYVLIESPEGLVLLDQHAAHERVLFERILKDLEASAAPSQKLLLPVTVEVDALDAQFLRTNLAVLQRLGLGVSEFGDRTFLVDAVPPYFRVHNLSQALRNIVDELRQAGEAIHVRRLGEDRIATAVCRQAVKARDPLKGEELQSLLVRLHQCDLPYTCPHGRPTMIQISYAELEKKFGRKV